MAAQKSSQGHPSSPQRAVTIDSFHRVFRTTRDITARGCEHGRNRPLVRLQNLQHHEFGKLSQNHTGLLPNFCSITAKARLTSFCTSAKSVFNNDFFGLITISTSALGSDRESLTAS